jgi:Thrombospondin type 3 repeat
MARRLRSALVGAVAVVACCMAPAAAHGVTIGIPDLEPATGAGIMCSASASCSMLTTSPAAAAPFDGLITRWRVRINAGSGTVRLRIVRPPGPTFLWLSSTADEIVDAGIHSFESHIPIARGDQLGITSEDVEILTQGAAEGFAGASTAVWNPPAADGTSPPPAGAVNGLAIGLNADVERDNDGDALGDETQDSDDDNDGTADASDNCPTTAGASQADTDGDGQGDICDGDDDNDGLPDSTETQLGSNPLNPDSDADGQPDGSDRCVLSSGPGGCPVAAILEPAIVALKAPGRVTRRVLAGGLKFTVTPDQPVALRVSLIAPGREKGTILAERSLPLAPGARSIRLKPSRRAAKSVKRVQLRVLAINSAGAQTELRRTVRIRR